MAWEGDDNQKQNRRRETLPVDATAVEQTVKRSSLSSPQASSQSSDLATGGKPTRASPSQEKPFAWQSKPVLRKIRESFDAEKTVASALLVYFALTEIASDNKDDTFQTTHAYIAQKSGLSPRTVQARLSGLVEIGLLEVSTPQLRAPATYRLLSVKQPLPNVQQQSKKGSLPTLEESKEESKEESLGELNKTSIRQQCPKRGKPLPGELSYVIASKNDASQEQLDNLADPDQQTK